MTSHEPMRADARRNREKLLTAALSLFGASGPDVSLEAIAREAGVGIGTLYRHFPTRDALVEAAYRTEVAHLCEAAAEMTLEAWMDRFVDYAATKKGMKGALQSAVASGSDVFVDTRRQILGAISTLLAAGIADGTLRSDVSPEDVFGAMGAIWNVDDPEQARRLLRLVLDGLRYGAS